MGRRGELCGARGTVQHNQMTGHLLSNCDGVVLSTLIGGAFLYNVEGGPANRIDPLSVGIQGKM